MTKIEKFIEFSTEVPNILKILILMTSSLIIHDVIPILEILDLQSKDIIIG